MLNRILKALGLKKDRPPIKAPEAQPMKPQRPVHTFTPQRARAPVPAPAPSTARPRSAPRPAQQPAPPAEPEPIPPSSLFGPGKVAYTADAGATWTELGDVADVRIRPASIEAGGGGDFTGGGASSSWDSSDSGSSSSDSGGSGGSD